MATINIGNLTFTHKGDYDGSTAYAKNDVVYYSTNGNAYIAKQATTGNVPTNATYWNQFAQGSGGIWNAGLSLGSAGQSVKVNSAGNALEFGTISSDFVKLASADVTSGTSFNINGYFSTDYRVFKIFFNHADTWHKARFNFGSSYTTYTSSNYVNALQYATRNSGGNNDGASGNWNSDSMFTTYWNGDGNQEHANAEITIFRPWDTNYAKNIQVISWDYNSSELHITNSTAYLDANKYDEAVTGIHIFPASGSIGETQWALYGIK